MATTEKITATKVLVDTKSGIRLPGASSNAAVDSGGSDTEASASVTTSPWAGIFVITTRRREASNIYDLSNICIDASMDLITSGVSSFNFSIPGEGFNTKTGESWSLVGKIMPMDRIIVVGGRSPFERAQMFTGYITNSTLKTYRRGDPIHFEAKDTLYRLSRIWIDPWVKTAFASIYFDKKPNEVLQYLLTDPKFGGYDPSDVFIADLDSGIS